jgi:hypothetical protein
MIEGFSFTQNLSGRGGCVVQYFRLGVYTVAVGRVADTIRVQYCKRSFVFRTGTLHVADHQTLDLLREEIDLPFNCHVYYGGYLGLAPTTFVHGVEIHLAGQSVCSQILSSDSLKIAPLHTA